MPLNERQHRFVDAYLKNPNATQAAIRAGYAVRGAKQQGSRLLTNVDVQQAFMERSSKIREQADVDATWVLKRLAMMADVRIADLFDEKDNLRSPSEFPDGAQYLIARIETEEIFEWFGTGEDRERAFTGYTKKIRLESRMKALELIGNHVSVQAWPSRHSVQGEGRPLLVRIDHRLGTVERLDADTPNDLPATPPPALKEERWQCSEP